MSYIAARLSAEADSNYLPQLLNDIFKTGP